MYRYTAADRAIISEARKQNKDKRAEKRLHALELRAEGKSAEEVAAATGFHSAYISQLSAKYEKGGIEAIAGNHYGGNRRNMKLEEERALLEPFHEKAKQGQIVEVSEIKARYEEKVGHSIGGSQIYYVLRRHNWRKVMPRSRHPKKASDEAIEASKKLKPEYTMAIEFAKVLKKLRTEKGLSQRELADDMYVTRSTIARWENGSRLPDITMISRLSRCLGADINILLNAVSENDGAVNVIILDDIKITLNGELSVIKNVLPNATVTGFTSPSEAIEYASTHSVALAFLDIELGKSNGLNICNELLNINPHTDVVYVTAYSNYSLDAWSTGACGFLLKPITTDDVKRQLKMMRYPYNLGDTV